MRKNVDCSPHPARQFATAFTVLRGDKQDLPELSKKSSSDTRSVQQAWAIRADLAATILQVRCIIMIRTTLYAELHTLEQSIPHKTGTLFWVSRLPIIHKYSTLIMIRTWFIRNLKNEEIKQCPSRRAVERSVWQLLFRPTLTFRSVFATIKLYTMRSHLMATDATKKCRHMYSSSFVVQSSSLYALTLRSTVSLPCRTQNKSGQRHPDSEQD